MNVTRGHGILENFLSNYRAKIADSNIPDKLRSGKILDIGCGNFPNFLSRIKFKHKYGLDKDLRENKFDNIELINFNFSEEGKLPFAEKEFEVVSILAVLEHLQSELAKELLREVARVLKDGGILLITVPKDKGDKLLRIFSKIGLVSRVEIEEHVQLYNYENITEQLLSAGFKKDNIKIESFELGFNIFVRVIK